ncbi:hypothetical protein TSAR_000329 [Trichomalopsis sarcophagae]|uniref:Uncharacterized protein n=1 Tax=Trichomalopsis sarcophagae TaxID=543379 RepID=A0A232EGS5_9HYME|nr:hypothetical protein TSAR_000329 [Trichomalopsis sarcophagae]
MKIEDASNSAEFDGHLPDITLKYYLFLIDYLEISMTNAVVIDILKSTCSDRLMSGSELSSRNTVRNQSVLFTNAAVDNTILKREMSIKNVILQLLGLFRFRLARSGSNGLLSEIFDFLISSLASLSFDGEDQIRMMTCTSTPFDGGGWIRMIL